MRSSDFARKISWPFPNIKSPSAAAATNRIAHRQVTGCRVCLDRPRRDTRLGDSQQRHSRAKRRWLAIDPTEIERAPYRSAPRKGYLSEVCFPGRAGELPEHL